MEITSPKEQLTHIRPQSSASIQGQFFFLSMCSKNWSDLAFITASSTYKQVRLLGRDYLLDIAHL